MKYLRKIVALLIAVVLAAAIAVGLGVIFAVRNVNVTLVSYSFEENGEQAKAHITKFKTQISDKVRGTLIGFVGEEDISSAIEDTQFVVDGYEKVYPCTLNVTVRERKETFSVQSGETFAVYDEHGTFVRTSTKSEPSCVLVEGASDAVGIKQVASVASIFKAQFSSLRTITEKITLTKASSQFQSEKISFHLRCGITVEIHDYNVLISEKIAAAYSKFTSLPGEYKLGGTIYSLSVAGTVTATYDQNG